MANYYEQLPDHIPYRHDVHQFTYTLKNLSELKPGTYLYADENGLHTVGKTTRMFQKIIGFFGGTDHTSIPNVEVGLAKLLAYGYAQDFMRSGDVRHWLGQVKTVTQNIPFSEHLGPMIDDLETNRATPDRVKDYLKGIHAYHGPNVAPLGGKTKIPSGREPSFGRTPIILAERALRKGNLTKALAYAENGYRLGQDHLEVGSLFLRIASAMKQPDAELVKRVEEFRDTALLEGENGRALKADKALHKLDPHRPAEVDGETLFLYGQAASSPEEALHYFGRAQAAGIPRGEIQAEQMKIFTSLMDTAQLEGNDVEALRCYELAVQNGLLEDKVQLGDLYLAAAQELQRAEDKKSGWGAKKDYSQVVDYYRKGMKAYSDARVLGDRLTDGNWLSTYLEALTHTGQVQEGLRLVVDCADKYHEFSLLPRTHSRAERLEHVKRPAIEKSIQLAIRLYEVAMRFDPKNGEHPFKIGNLLDFLNTRYDNKNPYEYFLRAAQCNPDQIYYRIGVIVAARKQGCSHPDWCAAGYGRMEATNAESWFQEDRFVKGASRVLNRFVAVED